MVRITGRYHRKTAGDEEVAAFIPHALPPADPPLALDLRARELLRAAEHALSRLELAGEMVPSIEWFVYAFVRKEAVLSSQIEGTQATLVDLLSYEAGARPEPASEVEVQEVCSYLEALTFARDELAREDGLPLSVRLLNETHRRLMKGVRGAEKQPGEVRRSQNWIGGTRPGNAAFVPPPPQEVPRLLGDLEKYLHAEDSAPALIRAGLAHVQFETIHPYLDGNGRLGRLLVILLLQEWKLLSQPLLYLSLFFKRRREDYYRVLSRVRTDGDWEGWTAFFLEGVAITAEEAVQSARALFALVGDDRARVLAASKASVVASRLFEELPRHPVVTISGMVRLLQTTKPTAAKAVSLLEEVGVLAETTGRRRDRTFSYTKYLDLLRVGTELE
ncbi:MAG: Fic family protein [Deltaproteobacteria bacterium]|nr:Fic family protein [Deltaproteobacteria bacterium]